MKYNMKKEGNLIVEETRGSRRVLDGCREKINGICIGLRHGCLAEDDGIDGILVTVGLCIIALLLCVVMKNSLSEFIKSIVASMTKEASDILSGTRV